MTRATWVLLAALAVSCAPHDPSHAERDETPTPSAVEDAGVVTPDPPEHAPPEPADPVARCEASQVGPPILRRLTRDELESTLRAAFPELAATWPALALPEDVRARRFANDASLLTLGNQAAEQLGAAAEVLAGLLTEPSMLAATLPCASTGEPSCARTLIERYGRRLFRRPLTTEEVDRYLALHASVQTSSDFGTGARWVLVALMQSPHTVYRRELGEGVGFAAGDARTLSPHELASELSYTFAGEPPSDALLAQAERGELEDPATRVRVARALLESEGGRNVVRRFFAEWLQYENVATQTKSAIGDDFLHLRVAMVDEMRAFLDDVVHRQRGGLRALLTADTTVVSSELAAFYGFPAPTDPTLPTRRPEGRGVGLLAQGALLANFASATHSSPTRRGVFVFKQLLCQDMPPPPPGVSTDLGAVVADTTRERMEAVHARASSCKTCHDQVDPIGFTLEHFDEAGRYRDDENGHALDVSGGVPRLGVEVDGQAQLATALAGSSEVSACVSGLMALYLTGGAGGQECVAEGARARFMAGQGGVLDYLAETAGEPHFGQRRVAGRP